MFQALKPLLDQCKSVDIKLVSDGDAMVVILIPIPKDGQKDASLRQPIKLQGTAAELDAGIAQAIAQIATARAGLVESVEAAEAAIEAAKKASDKKTVQAVHGKPKAATRPGTAAAAAASPELDGDELEEDGASATAAPAAGAAPSVATSSAGAGSGDYGDLFSI
jgi:PRTRC genetic system protein E